MVKQQKMKNDIKAVDMELNDPLLGSSRTEHIEENHLSHSKCLKAVGYQILGTTFTFLMGVFIKIGSSVDGAAGSQFLFVRGWVTMLFVYLVCRQDKPDMNQLMVYKKELTTRMILGFLANTFYNMGIIMMNMSMASTVFNTNPLFGVLLGAIVFREKITKLQIVTLLVTFSGVILLLKPCLFTGGCSEDDEFTFYMLYPLLGAIARALAMVFVRACKDIHWIFPTLALNAPFCIISPILGLMTNEFVPFTWSNFGTMFLYSLSGICANTFTVLALKTAEMGFSMPISYLAVIFASLTDVFVFHVSIAWNQWAGAAIILFGIIFVTYVKYESSKKKQ